VIWPESMIEVMLPVEVQRARKLARKNSSPDYLGPASSVVALAPPGAEMNPVNEVQGRVVENEGSKSDLAMPGNFHSLLFDSKHDISCEGEPTVVGTATVQCTVGQQELNIDESWLTLYRSDFLKLVDFAKRDARKTKAIARLAYGFRKLDKRIKLSFRLIKEVVWSSRSIVRRASKTSNGTTDFLLALRVEKKIGCV
jgi:hypothetical protein